MKSNAPPRRKKAPSPESAMTPGAKSTAAAEPVPVLVIGMHRSGTSALARVLNLMGVEVGDAGALLPPHPTDNPTGYWERADVVALHDQFLASAGYAWNVLGGFDASQCDVSAKTALADGLRNVIRELKKSGRSWLVKDPRLCLMLSQWSALLDRSACVVVVRDPREIAGSILREQLRGIYTAHFLLALWEKYLRSALTDLAGRRVLFVSYANLMAHPVRESARLTQYLGSVGVAGLNELSESALRACLDPHLKRSEAVTHAELSKTQHALAAWLDEQSQAPSAVPVADVPEGPSPDAILVEYRNVIEYTARQARDRALGELGGRVDACIGATLGAQEQLSALRKEQWEQLSALRRDQGATTEQVSALRGELFEALDARRQSEQQLADLRAEFDRATMRANSLEAERRNLQIQLAAAQQFETRMLQVQAELRLALDRGEALSERVAQLESMLAGTRSELESTRSELDSTRSDLESTRRSRERALEAAVKIRRTLDAQLAAARHSGDNQTDTDPE